MARTGKGMCRRHRLPTCPGNADCQAFHKFSRPVVPKFSHVQTSCYASRLQGNLLWVQATFIDNKQCKLPTLASVEPPITLGTPCIFPYSCPTPSFSPWPTPPLYFSHVFCLCPVSCPPPACSLSPASQQDQAQSLTAPPAPVPPAPPAPEYPCCPCLHSLSPVLPPHLHAVHCDRCVMMQPHLWPCSCLAPLHLNASLPQTASLHPSCFNPLLASVPPPLPLTTPYVPCAAPSPARHPS